MGLHRSKKVKLSRPSKIKTFEKKKRAERRLIRLIFFSARSLPPSLSPPSGSRKQHLADLYLSKEN